jgi:CRISPR/Cas system-associated endonuclease/helicase Cas3
MGKVYRKQKSGSFVVITTATMPDLLFNVRNNSLQTGRRVHMKHLWCFKSIAIRQSSRMKTGSQMLVLN